MKTAVLFLYVLCNIIYLSPIASSSMGWGAFNIITHIGFVGYLCYLLSSSMRNSKVEQLFFSYLMWLSVANCIYILFCAFREKNFALYNTDIFAYITGIGFIVFLVHCALNKS